MIPSPQEIGKTAMVRDLACWTEDDGIHACGIRGLSKRVFRLLGDHEHESVADAMKCLVPAGSQARPLLA